MRIIAAGANVKCKSELTDELYKNDGWEVELIMVVMFQGSVGFDVESFIEVGFGSWSEPELMPC